ncbi:MAG: hypothetical protein ACOC8H_01490 [bacterium]
MSYDAIYHPWIDPPDRAMIATAMLYWDRMYTIVPARVCDVYRNKASRIACDYGFLCPRKVATDSPEVEAASDEFLDDLDRHAVQTDAEIVRQNTPQLVFRDTRIHVEKMSRNLSRHLAAGQASDADGFYRVSSEMAVPYMSRLASVIARSDGSKPLTDRNTSQGVVVDGYVDTLPTGAEEAESLLATLSLSSIRMSPDTSLGALWIFREEHRSELERYRRAIRGLARQVGGAEGGRDIRAVCEELIADEINPAQEELSAKLGENGFDFGLATTQAALTGSLSALAGDIRIAAGVAAISLGFSYCRYRLGCRRHMLHEPFAYLVRAGHTFGAEQDET